MLLTPLFLAVDRGSLTGRRIDGAWLPDAAACDVCTTVESAVLPSTTDQDEVYRRETAYTVPKPDCLISVTRLLCLRTYPQPCSQGEL